MEHVRFGAAIAALRLIFVSRPILDLGCVHTSACIGLRRQVTATQRASVHTRQGGYSSGGHPASIIGSWHREVGVL